MKPTKAQALRYAEVLQEQGDFFKGSLYADACIASAKMWREFAHAEPDMKHPRIQAIISQNARKNIELRIVASLIENPDYELDVIDCEYETSMHVRLRELLKEQAKEIERLREEREWLKGLYKGMCFPLKNPPKVVKGDTA